MAKTKDNIPNARHSHRTGPFKFFNLTYVTIGLTLLTIMGAVAFEKRYEGRVYPNVSIGGVGFGGKTPREVEAYWADKNARFADATFELRFENDVATISAQDIKLGYDATLSATQAYLIGRSPNVLSNFVNKFVKPRVELSPYYHWDTAPMETTINEFAGRVNIPVVDALFKFENGRVTSFKPSSDGRKVNKDETRKRLTDGFRTVATTNDHHVTIPLAVDTIKPSITTDTVNTFGIKELIGRGYSEFRGSIPGRIHNVALAASRINGVLIKPGETFSFNDTNGDISAATGYQSAYIIKDGRTVLGDGGGVCQVSSTLFRAALNAGLPIVERHAHAYRVHYYEDGGFKPGIDATVFHPTVDLKFKNDTPGHILIQTKIDTKNLTLEFEFYGTRDGRIAEITNHRVWAESPPPPPLYQDDPTLPKGVVRQVDWAAWGARAAFDYRVTRNGEVLQNTTFSSNFRPWQAVFLQGTL